jgi:hypothetical protein
MTGTHSPERLKRLAEVLRGVADDGEAVLRITACPKGEACENCSRKWEAVRMLREAADYIDSQAVVH